MPAESTRFLPDYCLALLNASSEALLIADAVHDHILLANSRCETLFRYSLAQLVGHPVSLLLSERACPDAPPLADPPSDNDVPERAGQEPAYFGRRSDGHCFPASIQRTPINLAGNRQTIYTIQDVSARLLLERDQAHLLRQERTAHSRALAEAEDLRRLQSVSDSALAQLHAVDGFEEVNGRIRIALSAACVAILRRASGTGALIVTEASGIDPDDVRSLCGPGGFAERVLAVGATVSADVEDQTPLPRSPTGELIGQLLGVPLTIRGRPLGVLLVGFAERRQPDEQELHLLALIAGRVALAIENRLLYEAEHQARLEAEQTARSREAAFAVLTHDLGQPLTSFRTGVAMLRHFAGAFDAAAQDLIDPLEHATHTMIGLVQELHDLVRLEGGKDLDLRPAPCDLVALTMQEVQAVQQIAPRHHFKTNVPPHAISGYWDGARVGRVVANLIGNAVKYSPNGGTVTIRVGSEGTWATVAVIDEGLGIPSDDLPRVFDRYFRAGNVSAIRGSGLGLARARQIAEQHGGALDIASEEGRGTTVMLRLPLV